MTMFHVTGRADEFVLVSADSMVFKVNENGSATPARGWTGSKVARVTDRVLLAMFGCPFIGDDFHELMLEKVEPTDNLDVCRDVAQASVDFLWDYDLAGEAVVRNGVTYIRQSIHDRPTHTPDDGARCGFGFYLVGFDRNCRAGCAIYLSGERSIGAIGHAGVRSTMVAAPWGVNEDPALDQFVAFLSGVPLEPQLGPEGAAQLAFSAHRYIGLNYSDRTTEDVTFTLIQHAGDAFETFEYAIDWRDLDGFWQVYNRLEGLASPAFAAARRRDAAAIRAEQLVTAAGP